MSNLTDEALAGLLEHPYDLHPDTVFALVREVQALRAKVKEQREALDDAQQAAWEREEARD